MCSVMNDALLAFAKGLSAYVESLSVGMIDKDSFAPLIDCINSLPSDIRESDEFLHANSINGKTVYEDAIWMF